MEIRLRPLEVKDAPLMLEWMHDPDIQTAFEKDFMHYSLEDAQKFCNVSKGATLSKAGDDVHFAIADQDDEYLGTISLKNFDPNAMKAEYAISTRKKAHGKGVAEQATKLLLKKAFEDFGLNRVYLTVLSSNSRAIGFYEKCGFVREGDLRDHFCKGIELVDYCYYGMLKKEYLAKSEM